MLKNIGIRTLRSKTCAFLFVAVAVLWGGAFVATPAQSAHQQGSNAAAGQTAGQKFKNVQVLKDIPADQLIPAMQFITGALGVECDFCHVVKDGKPEFDKDDKKEKKTARKMMQMMFAINQNNLRASVRSPATPATVARRIRRGSPQLSSRHRRLRPCRNTSTT